MTAVQTLPKTTTLLRIQQSFLRFQGRCATGQFAQYVFMLLQSLVGGLGDGYASFQGVEHQLTDGVDLIFVRIIQFGFTSRVAGLSQNTLEKRFLPHHTILVTHTGNDLDDVIDVFPSSLF